MKADAEVTTLEAAQVAVEAIMIVDHMTEVVIVTAMIRVAVAVEVCSSLVSFFNHRGRCCRIFYGFEAKPYLFIAMKTLHLSKFGINRMEGYKKS